MAIQTVESFKIRANTLRIPTDLNYWLNNIDNTGQVLAELGFSLLTEEEITEAQHLDQLDFDQDDEYFSTKEVFSKIIFVAKNNNGKLFGYSLHDHAPLIYSPVTSFKDHFELAPGNLTEALIFELANENEEEFNKYKKALETCGIQIGSFQYLTENADRIYYEYSDPDDLIVKLKKGKDLSYLAFLSTEKDFLEWQIPRFGTENPTIVHSEHWRACIYSREEAYSIGSQYDKSSGGPTWCFSRFGQSLTRVNDKEIYIAGEHEDSYDPDFYIYNDVVVVNSDDTVEIYNYPKEVFPPTDFHTASLIDAQTILIIGSLGYMDQRKENVTPVYALNIDNFQIEKIETYGDNPGWIYRHKAILDDENKSIKIVGGEVQSKTYLENIDEWQLDLNTYQWTRLTNKKWKRWRLLRKDEKSNFLWNIRQALFSLNASWESEEEKIKSIREELGYSIDVTKVEELYRFNEISTYKELPKSDKFDTFKISIDDVIIRFQESHFYVMATVEGDLEDEMVSLIQEKLLKKLSKLENCTYVLVKYY